MSDVTKKISELIEENSIMNQFHIPTHRHVGLIHIASFY